MNLRSGKSIATLNLNQIQLTSDYRIGNWVRYQYDKNMPSVDALIVNHSKTNGLYLQYSLDETDSTQNAYVSSKRISSCIQLNTQVVSMGDILSPKFVPSESNKEAGEVYILIDC